MYDQAVIPPSSGLGWFWAKAGYVQSLSPNLRNAGHRGVLRKLHVFVGCVFKDSGCSKQVAFQFWSCPEKHVKRSWRMLWRPRGPKFPSMAHKQGYIPWCPQGNPSWDQRKQSEYLALWGPWEHQKDTMWINLSRTKVSLIKVFNINSPQTLLPKVHHIQQECAEGNVKLCSSSQPELKQQWFSETCTVGSIKLWGTGWVCRFPEFSKSVFEI